MTLCKRPVLASSPLTIFRLAVPVQPILHRSHQRREPLFPGSDRHLEEESELSAEAGHRPHRVRRLRRPRRHQSRELCREFGPRFGFPESNSEVA